MNVYDSRNCLVDYGTIRPELCPSEHMPRYSNPIVLMHRTPAAGYDGADAMERKGCGGGREYSIHARPRGFSLSSTQGRSRSADESYLGW